MTHLCATCQISFKSYIDYAGHLEQQHRHKALESHPKAVLAHSRSISGRSKAEIVANAEASWLAPLIITTSNEQEHLGSCRCQACFQKALDKLIVNQEMELAS